MSEESVGNNDWIPHISRLFSEVPHIPLRWSDELNAGFPYKPVLRSQLL
jgi:hypothetical protein